MIEPRPTSREEIRRRQLASLRELIAEILPRNRFYGPRLRAAGIEGPPESLEAFTAALPLTTKEELVQDQQAHPPWGTNLTYPLERYTRFHQTSGSTGAPMRWPDTAEGWAWQLGVWKEVFRTAGVTAADRVFFPFSFGPFLGFWTAFDAAEDLGCLVIPGGGLNSASRLSLLLDIGATVLCATPTYALRLAEVAQEKGFDLGRSQVRAVVVAGEPGGSVPATRERLSAAWGGALVLDHHGMTEVGPVSFPNPRIPDLLHVAETSYLAEILNPETGEAVPPGTAGELVLTTLGRPGSPLLRYRTGDLVRASERPPEELGRPELALEGGILARVDDMVVVRGVNLYPSALEQILRSQPEVGEFRVELSTRRAMTEVKVLVEPAAGDDPRELCRRVEDALRTALQLRIPVEATAPGSLPRFELKARRWVRADAPCDG